MHLMMSYYLIANPQYKTFSAATVSTVFGYCIALKYHH